MIVYEVLLQDEYDNLIEIGWFKDKESILDFVNPHLEEYYDAKLTVEDLCEITGSFGVCICVELRDYSDVAWGVKLRGFIRDYPSWVVEYLVNGDKQ